MTAVDELRAMAAIVLAVSLPVALVLFAVWSATRSPAPSPSLSRSPSPSLSPEAATTATFDARAFDGAAPQDAALDGRVGAARLLAWAGGLSLGATAVLLLLA